MKVIHIDFAPHTMARAILLARTRDWILGFVGLALCIGALATALTMMQRQSERGAELSAVRAKLAQRLGRQPAAKKTALAETQAAAINKAIAQLNLPWGDMLDAVESATPPTVALLALEPDARKRSLKGLAEAKTSDDMIAYVEALKKQKFFDLVLLTKHEVNDQDPNRPLRFQFEASWLETAR